MCLESVEEKISKYNKNFIYQSGWIVLKKGFNKFLLFSEKFLFDFAQKEKKIDDDRIFVFFRMQFELIFCANLVWLFFRVPKEIESEKVANKKREKYLRISWYEAESVWTVSSLLAYAWRSLLICDQL